MSDNRVDLIYRAITEGRENVRALAAEVDRLAASTRTTGTALKTQEQATAQAGSGSRNFQNELKALDAEARKLRSSIANVEGGVKKTTAALTETPRAAAAWRQRLAEMFRGASKDSDQFAQKLQQGTQTAFQSLDRPMASLGVMARSLASALGPIGIAIVGIGTVAVGTAAGISTLTVQMGTYAETILRISQSTGLTTVEVGQFQAAAEASGGSIQQFVTSMRMLSQVLSDNAEEGKRGKDAMRELGVAIYDVQSGAMRPLSHLLLDLSAKFAALPSGPQKAEYAIKIFGRAGLDMIPILNELAENTERFKRLGFGIDQETLTRLDATGDRLESIQKSWSLLYTRAKIKLTLQSEGFVEAVEQLTTLIGILTDPKKALNELQQGFWARIATMMRSGWQAPQPGDTRPVDLVRPQAPMTEAESASIRLLESALGRVGGQKETLQREIAQAKKDVESAVAFVEQLKQDAVRAGHIGPTIASEAVQKMDAAIAKLRGYEGQLRATEEAEQRLKESRSLVEGLERRARAIDAVGQKLLQIRTAEGFLVFGQAQQQTAVLRERAEARDKVLPQFRDRVTEAFAPRLREAWAKDMDDLRKQAAELSGAFAQLNESIQESVKGRVFAQPQPGQPGFVFQQMAEEQLAQSLRAMPITLAEEPRFRQAQAEAQARQIEAAARPGEEFQAIQRAAALRLDAAMKETEATRIRIEMELSGIERVRAERELEIQSAMEAAQIRWDVELRILELQRRQMEEFRQQAGEVFDALVERGTTGIRDLLRAQLQTQLRTIFVNASAEIFAGMRKQLGGAIPGQVDASGNQTWLGRLLQGSVFSPQPMLTLKTATDLNSAMTRDNTRWLSVLNSTIGRATGAGGGTAGGAGSLVPGLFGVTQDMLFGGGSWASNPAIFSALGQQSQGGGYVPRGTSAFFQNLIPFQGGLFAGLRGGDYSISTGAGTATTASAQGLTSTAGRVANVAGSAAVVAGGTMMAIQGFREGGARGNLQGASAVLGTAAAFDPEPISKAILTVAALITGFASTILGDPKAARDEAIGKMLERNKFTMPESINVTTNMLGQSLDQDFRGRYRVVSENWTLNIRSFDSADVISHGPEIAESVRRQMHIGHPIAQDIREQTLP